MTIKASSYPTSRPTLDLNFAQTKRLDPRVTFTRSSTGTYFDANGVLQSAATNTARFDHNPATGESLGLLVEESRTNLWTVSANPGFAGVNGTVVPNAAVAPDGTITAAVFTPNAASDSTGRYLIIPRANTLNTQQTVSFFIKTTYSYLVFCSNGQDSQSNVSVNVGINLTTDSVYQTTTANGAYTSASVFNAPNGYKRIAITYSNGGGVGGKQPGIIVSDTQFAILGNPGRAIDQTANYTTDGIKSLTIWGVQLETASFPTSYIPTPATFTSRASSATYYDANGVIQTAGTNVARSAAFFPDSNGVMRSAGLLLEAAGTNLVTYSEDLTSWTSPFWTVTANATQAPDGNSTADLAIANAGTTTQSRDISVSVVAGTTYTASIFAKAKEFNSFILRPTGSNSYRCTFTLAGLGSTSPTGGTAKITPLPNSWYLCSFTFVEPTGGTRSYGIQTAQTSDGVSGFFVWGAQLETGSFSTSYIATTTATVTRSADVSSSATVTRSADVASITGTNFSSWYNQSEGTMFVDASAKGSTAGGLTSSFLMTLNVTGSHIFADVLDQGTSVRLSTYNGSSSPYSVSPSTSGAGYGSRRKAVLALKSGNYGAALNGAIQANGTNASALNAYDRLGIGYYPHFDYGRINSTISRLTYWPTRLSDATLQAITL